MNASFETHSTISGKVVDAEGKPARGIRVELGELQPGSHVKPVWLTWANSDEEGKFTIRNVPVGKVVLAANLNGAPSFRMPFDTVYAPGTQDLAEAQVFNVPIEQAITNVTIQVPEPLPFGEVYVDVLWADGSPALDQARVVAQSKGLSADVGYAARARAESRCRWYSGETMKFWQPGTAEAVV